MAKKLTTLESHNAQRRAVHIATASNEPRPNGIACPKCGAELMDSQPLVQIMTNPPRMSVHCPKCGYMDSRLA